MRTRNLKVMGALVLAVGSMALQACGGDDEALIGEWSEIESGTTYSKYTFFDDGNFSLDQLEEDGALHPFYAGTFSTDGDRLTTEGQLSGEGVLRLEATYYVDDTQFGRVALLPVGEVDGVVGTWHSYARLDNLSEEGDSPDITEKTLSIAADGAVHLIDVDGDRSTEYDGGYVVDDDGRFEFELDSEVDTLLFHLTPIEGAALVGSSIYVR
jgi:hypothetical protein